MLFVGQAVDASKAGIKVAPSKVFCDPSENVANLKSFAALEALEEQLSEETKAKYAKRLAEGYDLDDVCTKHAIKHAGLVCMYDYKLVLTHAGSISKVYSANV